jgi:hypothetical protein
MQSNFTYPDIKNLFGLSTARLTQLVTADFIQPSIEKNSSGRANIYSFDDMVQIEVVIQLLAARTPATYIRSAMKFYRESSEGAQQADFLCVHRNIENNPATMTPSRLNSVLTSGYMAFIPDRISFDVTDCNDFEINIVVNLKKIRERIKGRLEG